MSTPVPSAAPAAPSSPGILAKVGALLGKLVAALPASIRPTQKWVAHAVVTVLTGAAVAALPLEVSASLNGVIVIIAGLIAPYVIPNAP